MTATITNPLKQYADVKRWVNWKLETNDKGESTKVPYQPNKAHASSTDPATWRTLAEVQAHTNGFNGAGIVFTPDRLLLGIDGDHILDSMFTITDYRFRKFVNAANTYTEYSPSNTGLHVFLALTDPLDLIAKKKKFKNERCYECYTQGRYFTVTFYPYVDKPIRQVTPAEAIELLKLLDYPWSKAALGDDELLQFMFKYDKSGSARALYDGDTSNNGNDDSAADLALCDRLIWWTNHNQAQTERLWLNSKLGQRDKVKNRKDYRDRTIQAADNYVKGGYGSDIDPDSNPDLNRAPGGKPAPDPDTPPASNQVEGKRTIHISTCTDVGNAERFALQHANEARYVKKWGWMIFDGKRWIRDDLDALKKMAKATARSIYAQAAAAGDDTVSANLAKWAKESHSRNRISAMLELAESELAVSESDFDRDLFLFNCQNGTLDLRSGELHPHAPGDLLTKLAGTTYTPGAPCELWRKSIERIQAGDKDKITFLQTATGYTLSGDTSEHCLFFLYGTGRNGKTTFTEVIQEAAGDYAGKIKSDTLLVKYGDTIPTDLASTVGKRMLIAEELPEGRKLDEALVKSLTGGDRQRARFLHRDFFDFDSQAKLWMFGNHKPTIRGTDEGIWSRVRLIPFEVYFSKDDRDPHLKEKLIKRELPGILNWMIEGYQTWQRDGLKTPGAIEKATNAYRSEMDVLAQFISECCELGDKFKSNATALHNAYRDYCGDKDAVSKTEFGKRLKERGFMQKKGTGGARMWAGVRLTDEPIQAEMPEAEA